jgi:predicted O-linked N-acetylglucosamine transferase (SPINDLY family)
MIPETLAIAVQHHQAGRLHAAEQIYRQILAIEPNHADALHLLGVVAGQLGKHELAIEHIGRAIGLKGDDAAFHSNLGIAFKDQGKLDEAIACYRRALELQPGYAEAHHNLGNALRVQGKLDEAIAAYRRVLELKPDLAEAHNSLGAAFQDQGKLDEAIACCRRALELKPGYAGAHNNLGLALKDQGKLDEAVACYRRALELRPELVRVHSSLLYTLHYCPGYDAQAIYEEHRRWNLQHAEPLAQLIQPHLNDRDPNRRLRIGYVSPDFRNHPLPIIAGPLFRAHNHQDFEIYCYSDVVCPDGITASFRSSADVWRNIVGLTDEQVAERIRQDRIDILVDLCMHMAHSRLLVFARKPAPLQVCWFAYPGTTGLGTIDYRLTDPYLDPPGLNDRHYSERSVRLPDTFWCYDPMGAEPAVNDLPAREKGHVVFGCLNNFCKVNAAVLSLWARVLRAVDGSRLMMLAKEGSHRQHTLGLLEQEGVASDRVTFVALQPRLRYLELYHDIDLGLDTFPYNGHTTSLDSFWMGVPVVTIVGQTAVGRAGLSQLTNLGLPELAANTAEQFVGIAVGLAEDLPCLSKLRASLRQRMQRSPLMDGPRFARNIEAAWRTLWRRWCAR